jgi:hypothetical protein
MGMFTTVKTPWGEYVQFKVGDDTCDTVRFGEAIECLGGEDLNEVTHGYGRDGDNDLTERWVVIKGGMVVAVAPGNHEDEFEQKALAHMYGIQRDDAWVERCEQAADWEPWHRRARRAVKRFFKYMPPWGRYVRRRENARMAYALTMPLIRSMWPKLVAEKVVNVDNLGVTGKVHLLDFSFDSKEEEEDDAQ